MNPENKLAYFHLPGLFEFYDLYASFLPLTRKHPEWFYSWAKIGSVYGSPADCLWGGGRVGFGYADPNAVLELMDSFGISCRLTFSNSLLEIKHLDDRKCNELLRIFSRTKTRCGIIIYSDLLLDYISKKYSGFYFVSSTTKVLTEFGDFKKELDRPEFDFVVPDFRLNRDFKNLENLPATEKDKVEFLCNECCWAGCQKRKQCYENVSRKNLGIECEDHRCSAPDSDGGYRFSKAMDNPCFVGVKDIVDSYLPMGFSNFKIEGRSLGSAMVLEFLLHYLVKPECQLKVREEIYLDSSLDLF